MNRNFVWIVCVSCVAVLASCAGPDVRTDTKTPEAKPTKKPVEPVAAAAGAHAAVGKPVTAKAPPNSQYPADGVKSLVDGRMGSEDFEDVEWMGWWYEDKPFEATIDLGELVAIQGLGVHTLLATESWIFLPRSVQFEVSADGETYKKVATIKPTDADQNNELPETKVLKASNLKEKARYVRVRAERFGELPKWHQGHGGADGYEGQAWLFIDEILVNPK